MSSWLYIEINIICIIIAVILLLKISSNTDRKQDNILFMRTLLACIILFLLDGIWALIDNDTIQVAVWVNKLVNAAYMIQTGALGYSWLLYCNCVHNPKHYNNRKKLFICAIPLIILFIICISSIWNGYVFYIDDNNIYHRGPYNFIQVVIGLGYIIVSSVISLYRGSKDVSFIRKKDYTTLASFAILPLLGAVMQTFFEGIPTLCAGIILSMLSVYITMLERQVSLDGLTQLNNRHQLNKYLTTKMDNHSIFYVLMMDVDLFKRINDTYGHVMGDAALIEVAGILKISCGKKRCFISRYGGDEFVIIYDTDAFTDVSILKEEIQQNLQDLNMSGKNPFTLSLSIGSAMYDGRSTTIPQLIAMADIDLYKIKKNKKDS